MHKQLTVLVDKLQVQLSPLFWALSIHSLIQLDLVLAPTDPVISQHSRDVVTFTSVKIIPWNLFGANSFFLVQMLNTTFQLK